MRQNFDAALKEVLRHEGGYANHPKDPGGATMKGVTQRVYDAYRQRLGLAVRSVRLLADDELRDIYRKQYWDAVKGDDLPSGVDYAAFDFAVNSGPARAAKCLQMALGVQPDGVIGQVTLRAAEEAEAREVINGLCDRRLVYVRSLSTFATFGEGWTRRIAGVRRTAITMAGSPPQTAPAQPPAPAPQPVGKRTILSILAEIIAIIFRSRK